MKPFKSITGIEVNNPNICIKGNGNFACLCEKCGEEPAVCADNGCLAGEYNLALSDLKTQLEKLIHNQE